MVPPPITQFQISIQISSAYCFFSQSHQGNIHSPAKERCLPIGTSTSTLRPDNRSYKRLVFTAKSGLYVFCSGGIIGETISGSSSGSIIVSSTTIGIESSCNGFRFLYLFMLFFYAKKYTCSCTHIFRKILGYIEICTAST